MGWEWSWGWAHDGVNASIPRNTGPECSEYLSVQRRIIESIFVISICLWILKKSIENARPILLIYENAWSISLGRQLLLIGMTFTLGLELGFKFASRTVIYILNPCHITSIIQIYLLASGPSKAATVLFRIQLNLLNGPLLAYLFPEIESRTIPLEAVTYYVQHGLMFIIPIYLLKQGGAYTAEPLGDFSWNLISYMLLLIYHFTVLQICAIPFQINLNHMLCPAILDPFEGQNYRLFACIHQLILCPCLCKIFCYLFQPYKQDRQNTVGYGDVNDAQQNNYKNITMLTSLTGSELSVNTATFNKFQLDKDLSSDNTGCDDNNQNNKTMIASTATQLIRDKIKKVE